MNSRVTLVLMLVLFITLGSMPLPASAQDGALVRFANMAVGSTALSITDNAGTQLADVGEFGAATGYVALNTDISGLVYNARFGSSYIGGANGSPHALFESGHEYLVMLVGTVDNTALVVFDTTAEFGGDTELGHLLLLHYVTGMDTGAYTLQKADGSPLVTQFLTPDFSGFFVDVASAALGVMPGQYVLEAQGLVEATALTLDAGQVVLVVVVGSFPDEVHAFFIADGETP